MIKLIECPRDAIQGIQDFIPAKAKAKYINELLQAGFDAIDFGSFVSPKAIPQMAETAEVLKLLDTSLTQTKLLAIVANKRGAEDACMHDEINYLGYPFSVSETFQLRNTGTTIKQSVERVIEIQELCLKNKKQLVIYISMGFGNPYGDVWNSKIVLHWINELSKLNIKIFSLADTVGVATPESISYLFNHLIPAYPQLEFGAHLHTTPQTWKEKIEAAYNAGCRRFDGAVLGYGGCPMAADELIGNMPTEKLVEFIKEKDASFKMDETTLQQLQQSFQQLISA